MIDGEPARERRIVESRSQPFAAPFARVVDRPLDAIPLDRPLSLSEVPTPALIIEVAALERNLAKMATAIGERKKRIRPHTKTHKCPLLARRQLDLGAVGVCCAKVSEAEVQAAAGIGPILITSPVVTEDKIARVVALAVWMARDLGAARGLEIVVDDAGAVDRLGRAARSAGIGLGVLIDLDPGTGRTGIAAGDAAIGLARRIVDSSRLELRGLQAYAGHLMHVAGHAERRRRSHETWAPAIATFERLRSEGIAVDVLTGAGTGTWDIDCELEAITDLQVGSYLFMDTEYRAIGGPEGAVLDDFDPSLFVLATAISKPRRGWITVDAGTKALAFERVRPEVAGHPEITYNWAGDEHGMLELGVAAGAAGAEIGLGSRLRIVPAHCDPTVNLYDFYYPVIDGEVRELWPISARGCSQ